ncbi:hypothetical protein H4R19_004038 [Coemansia spiralis]|nr:hypothetical protein H4R19_004038 [Coemansia spiralis]
MAVETRQALDEYEKSVDYVRRLCEGEQVDGLPAIKPECHGVEPSEAASGSPRFSSRRAAQPALPVMPPANGHRLVRQTPNGASPGARRQQQQQQQQQQANGAKHKSGTTHDACDSCGQPGQFICCEQCPRVFHFMCVEPPMTPEAVSQIDEWYCCECTHQRSRKRKSRAHAKSIFYPLISKMEYSNPRTFAVPDEIRRLFDGVEADADGAYVNVREDRPRRAHAGPASRDFDRLLDDRGDAILCYRCGLSALHGLLVRCDYCPLSWHWDCLDPPLSSAPPAHRRWMCPNHADHAMGRRQKFRKERIVDHTSAPAGTRNSGLIDVVDDDPPWHEICDPRTRYRTTSTRIRTEFARNAAPCRVVPPPCKRAPSPAPAAADEAPACTPPPAEVAEWLQAISVLQQGEQTAEPLDERSTCRASAYPGDTVAALASVATRILAPASNDPPTQAPTRNGLHSAGPRPHSQRRLQQPLLLAEHGLARSDLEAAIGCIASGLGPRCPPPDAATSPARTRTRGGSMSRRSQTPPPPVPAAATAAKRRRATSVAGDRPPCAGEARDTASRAAALLASLLQAKGAGALVDFLLAD